MSKNKHIYNTIKPVVDEPVETEVVEEVVETVEEAVEESVEEPVAEVVEPEVIEPVTYTIGVVSCCNRLRVRKFPNLNAPVLCELDVNTEVMIDMKESANGFYKVCTETGIDGYCMKKFITVK